jgi:glycosyltransferase involved in cell wall biosynthesis
MPELLQGAAVYVSPALSDGASAALLEALATGCLPVVADIEANREWIQDGANGLLFRPGDEASLAAALERALADGALRARARAENPGLVAGQADLAVNGARLEALLGAAVHRGRPSRQFGT